MYPKIFLTKFQNSFVLLKGKILVSFLWAFLEYLLHLKFSVNKIFSIHFFFAIFYLMSIFIKQEKDLQISKNVKKKRNLSSFLSQKNFTRRFDFYFFSFFPIAWISVPSSFPNGRSRGSLKNWREGKCWFLLKNEKLIFCPMKNVNFFPIWIFPFLFQKFFVIYDFSNIIFFEFKKTNFFFKIGKKLISKEATFKMWKFQAFSVHFFWKFLDKAPKNTIYIQYSFSLFFESIFTETMSGKSPCFVWCSNDFWKYQRREKLECYYFFG